MAMREVREHVEPYLNASFQASSLATLECRLRYIPIIMRAEKRARYPARSELLKKERIYDCAPQLDFEVFVVGTFEDQLKTYLSGIEETALHLSELGATEQQVKDFQVILANAAEHILARLTNNWAH